MDENLKITLIGLLTLVFGTIFASILASIGFTNMILGLSSFLVAAIIVVTGFRLTDHHLASKH
ncbi:hypothetical protein [Lentilactobacillus buchneri]|uniref:Uncharacterized protein n=1 Tax=Lentilactobacillus buchneri DSM 20057 TaxID=1423728 RepID=A0A4R5NNE4_LENBU|nr:hypothetical protein [Lentilactobacillus buchneri]WCJ51229.1 hypothetical protein OKF32_08075 [Lentilactobacillus sp. Egmn17]AEB72715.1 hypothetical protein Lbuc_0445 [Lentilactobacillus buchneri NRRL B-30929]KRK69110.1 hypothetical protein FC79_GL002055 [Lentilactobacillus buchneri DSM 20057]MCT2881201.1 hypothetical protein [Lentilactobacillus buchneri]MCT2897429.1 hypothetical protein [Lentilactobacillus buchneri]